MPRFVPTLRSLLLPLLGALALGLTGCSESERPAYATEGDEPAYREGTALLKTGRRQEALNAFLKVIEKRDDAPESHLSIALIYQQHINDPLSAIYHFKKYLSLRPNAALAPQVRQRIDACIREFARTLPAQPLESQLQRVDLVAALDRLKQENESLKRELADLKASRSNAALTTPGEAAAPSPSLPAGSFNFATDSIPVVHTRPAPIPPVRTPAPAPQRLAPAPAAPPSPARPSSARRHVVLPGDTLSKIALKYYNNRARWRDIFAANRDVLRSEADLKVGMELKIP